MKGRDIKKYLPLTFTNIAPFTQKPTENQPYVAWDDKVVIWISTCDNAEFVICICRIITLDQSSVPLPSKMRNPNELIKGEKRGCLELYCIPWKNCHMSNSNVNSLLIIKVAELADVIKFILAKNQEEILHSIAWAVKITNKWHLSDDQNSQKNCNIQTFGDGCLIGQKRDCHGKITDILFPSWSILNKGTIWTIISDVILLVSLMLTLCSLLFPSLQSEWSEKSCSDYKN